MFTSHRVGPASAASLVVIAILGGCTAGTSGPTIESSETAAARWSCSYEPTMDDNWHNDVLCVRGLDSQRPLLLRGDTFITEDEIKAAAQRYEERLNRRK